MKAIKIDVVKQQVYEVDMPEAEDYHLDAIYKELECECFTQVGKQFENGDVLFVDDNGLLKYKPLGFFKISDYPQPLSGHGLLMGVGHEGEAIPVKSDLKLIRNMVSFYVGLPGQSFVEFPA